MTNGKQIAGSAVDSNSNGSSGTGSDSYLRPGLTRWLPWVGPVLIVLAVGLLAGGIALQWRLATVAPHPEGIAHIAEEKSLVQSVQKASVDLLNLQDTVTAGQRLEELQRAYHDLKENHKRLVSWAESRPVPQEISSELTSQVFPRYRRITEPVRELLEYSDSERTMSLDDLKPLVAQIESETESYLFNLDHLHLFLGSMGRSQIESLQKIEGVLIITASGLLLIIACLQVPISRALKKYHNQLTFLVEELNDKNTILSELFFKVERKADEITDRLNTFAHDLRTPLNSTILAIELIQEEVGEQVGDDIRELLSAMKQNNKDASDSISKFLQSVRTEGILQRLELGQISLRPFIERVEKQFRPRAARRGLSFEIQIAPDCPETLKTDPDKLDRVLTNLLSNAFKYTEVGSVTLTVQRVQRDGFEQPHLEFEVADTGLGIAQDDLDELFKPFATVKRQKDSIGLGLVIVRRLVELMQGEIEVESERGAGSRFIARVPETLEDSAAAESREAKDDNELFQPDVVTALRSNKNLAGARVLLIDDSTNVLLVMAKFFRMIDVEVEAVGSAEEALELLEDGRDFDVIFMDLDLPQMDGIEACRRMRRMGVDTPLVGVTGHFLTYTRQQCLDAGFNYFIEKPLTSVKLGDMAVKALKRGEELGARAEGG